MRKILILLFAALILFSGCVSQKTVEIGDNVSVDYTGSLENGSVFDTSIESVARAHNLFTAEREYKPFRFTVGKKEAIPGFDEGVIGMKIGESKTLTIPPEKAYGPVNPERINVYPMIDVLPTSFPRIIEIPSDQFEMTFGAGHKKGDIVTIPGTSVNMTVQNISTEVKLSYNFKVGDEIPSSGAPWNQTVIKIDETNITVKYSLKKNDTIQLENVPWNTTVVNVTAANITLRHNAIPDTEIQTMLGPIKVSFNETSIIMDQNHPLAGKTLLFNVTLRSID